MGRSVSFRIVSFCKRSSGSLREICVVSLRGGGGGKGDIFPGLGSRPSCGSSSTVGHAAPCILRTFPNHRSESATAGQSTPCVYVDH